jgi:formate dehydrogenase subunit gamma
MEGAFDAMATGEVDLNWAKEHHSLWVEKEQAKGHAPSGSTPRAMPADKFGPSIQVNPGGAP